MKSHRRAGLMNLTFQANAHLLTLTDFYGEASTSDDRTWKPAALCFTPVLTGYVLSPLLKATCRFTWSIVVTRIFRFLFCSSLIAQVLEVVTQASFLPTNTL